MLRHLLLGLCLSFVVAVSFAHAGDPEKTPEAAPAAEANAPDAVADDTVHVMRLSLRDALQKGVGGNLTLLEQSYEMPIAWQGRRAAEASFDYLLTAGLSVSHNETPSTNVFSSAGVGVENLVNAQIGVTRRMRSGGTVSLLYRADRISTNNPFATVDPGYAQGLSVEMSYPLLRGAGDIALADIRRAQNGVVAARAGYSAQVEGTLLAIEETYWELVYADANLQTRRKAEEVARELLDDAKSRLDAEVGTPLDVAEANAGVQRRRSEVLSAENLRETLEDQLLSLIVPFGPSVRRAIRVEPTDTVDTAISALPTRADEGRFVALALQGRPELLASRAEIASAGIDVVVARDAIRPQLDIIGRIASDGLDSAFGGSIGDVATGEATSATIGLEFSLYLGQRAARAEWLSASWRRRQALLRRKELENEIVVEVRKALRDLQTARGQLAAGKAEVAAADEGLEGERLKLDQGKSTPFRVLQKEDDRTAATTREARAAADLRIAEARLQRSVGSLAASRGVQVRHRGDVPEGASGRAR
ncbi:MAG: TolC family protein [Planctomycetota bacterium]|nr:TolC family protein [Planctomycetota bacterium]